MRPHFAICLASRMSECLPEADVELEGLVHPLARVEREGDVQPDRSEAREVSYPQPGSPAQGFLAARPGIIVDGAAVHEGHDADMRGHPHATLAAQLNQRGAAEGIPIVDERAEQVTIVAADA